MIEDILNTIHIYRRGKISREHYRTIEELAYIKRLIGDDVYKKVCKRYGEAVTELKFEYDSIFYVSIERGKSKIISHKKGEKIGDICISIYKSFLYGQFPYYEEEYRTYEDFNINDKKLKKILLMLSKDYRKNGYKMGMGVSKEIYDILGGITPYSIHPGKSNLKPDLERIYSEEIDESAKNFQ